MESHIKKILNAHMPSLLNLLGEQDLSWTPIDIIFQKHLTKIRNEVESIGEGKHYDANLYSIIIQRVNGKKESEAMFDFYDKLFKSLKKNLNQKELTFLRKTIVQVLKNVDKNYLNFIGELGVLNKLILTGEYTLKNVEEKIHPEHKVSSDFLLVRRIDNIEVLIEVLNIHIEDLDILEFDILKYHLESKIKKKIKAKSVNPNRIILFQPVIWYKDLSQLELVCQFYSKMGIPLTSVVTPMAYLSHRLKNGTFEHRFESVNTILKDNTLWYNCKRFSYFRQIHAFWRKVKFKFRTNTRQIY